MYQISSQAAFARAATKNHLSVPTPYPTYGKGGVRDKDQLLTFSPIATPRRAPWR